jgi:hypothetical protein
MNLIDNTYFTGKIPLPGLEMQVNSEATGMDKLVNDLTVNSLNLTQFIRECRGEYLRLLLGGKLSGSFTEHISSENPAEIWVNLRNRLVNDELKISPIANYVYFFIMRYGVTRTSVSGEKKDKSDYAGNASIKIKSVLAWNDMVNMNDRFAGWFWKFQDDYAPYMDGGWSPDEDLFERINTFNL